MENQLTSQVTSNIPIVPIQRDSTTGHSSSYVQQVFPEYIFERSVEHRSKEVECIPKTHRVNIVNNLSTINIADLYSQTNPFSISNAPQSANDVETLESQFLLHYPIIRRRTQESSSQGEKSSSSCHGTITQTAASKDHSLKEGFICKQPQCSPSAMVKLPSRTPESTQGMSIRTSVTCFSEGNQTPVNRLLGGDERTTNNVFKNENEQGFDDNRSESFEKNSSICKSATVGTETVSCNVTLSDSPVGHVSKARLLKEPNGGSAHAPKPGEMTDEFTSINKKRKVDHAKIESQFRSGCTAFKKNLVFQKWGQVSRESPVVAPSTEKSVTHNNSSAGKINVQNIDFNITEKNDSNRKFRKWITDRTSCLSKLKNNNHVVSRDENDKSLLKRTDVSSSSGQIHRCPAISEGLVSNETNRKIVLEKSEEEDCSYSSTKSRPTRLRPRNYRHILLTKEHRTRAYLKERSKVLGRWFVKHFTHPYPSKEQKDKLAEKTKMSRNQVSEWFGNMRRRVKDATRDRSLCWEERVQCYNDLITGKSEPLPIMPHDTINNWTPEMGGHLTEVGDNQPGERACQQSTEGLHQDVRIQHNDVGCRLSNASGHLLDVGIYQKKLGKHLDKLVVEQQSGTGMQHQRAGDHHYEEQASHPESVRLVLNCNSRCDLNEPQTDGQESRPMIQCLDTIVGQDVAEINKRLLAQGEWQVAGECTYPTSQARLLINHEIDISNRFGGSNSIHCCNPNYKTWHSQIDRQPLTIAEAQSDSCPSVSGEQYSQTMNEILRDEAHKEDSMSSEEHFNQEDEEDSLGDCRRNTSPRTPEPATMDTSVDDRSSSTKFKRELIHRFLNDSSDSLPTPSSLPNGSPVNNDSLTTAKLDLLCSRRLFTEIRKRSDTPHTVPVARVDPWPCKKSSRLSLKVTSPQHHPKEKTIPSNEDPLLLSYSSRPKTYSRIPRHEPYSIVRSTSEPQSIIPHVISMHSSFPNLLNTHTPLNSSYFQHLSATSTNPLPNTTGTVAVCLPVSTSSPNDVISGHPMFVHSNSFTTLPSFSLATPHTKQAITGSFEALPALPISHIGRQIKPLMSSSPSVLFSSVTCSSFTNSSATVTPAYRSSRSMTQTVNHSSDEITAAYSLMQLQKM